MRYDSRLLPIGACLKNPHVDASTAFIDAPMLSECDEYEVGTALILRRIGARLHNQRLGGRGGARPYSVTNVGDAQDGNVGGAIDRGLKMAQEDMRL